MEPNFALAHAALADVWNLQKDERYEIGNFGQRNSPFLATIRAEVDRSLAIDPTLAEAHAAMGNLLMEAWISRVGRRSAPGRRAQSQLCLGPLVARPGPPHQRRGG